ncbi:ParB/Srx family N-terminal domain-containing protein [Photobacterium sp. SDRW27]|uniref:ParB/Srx family N-terminal domain-containing protein n=1 Tax=Photobacterium obscurum TaxID=2829490 RepID=UPI002243BD96|nr:ParB/Srx family N-terminal domain-containing protein [Photobacterium obscurum]MCW8327902.1 ParB/Srx family N-terminal domain-containing protein [Photobacterium obscurum]
MLILRDIFLFSGFSFATFGSSLTLAEKVTYEELKNGDVITVKLDQLLPTQALLSYDREFSNLYRYTQDLKNMYNDLCKVNGGKGVKKWNEDSQPTDSDSYTCKDKPGTHTDALSTVVVGPEEGILYLTQGHHILSTFWDMPNGGTSVPVMVKVTHNLLGSGDDFWPEMNNDHEVWLVNEKGKKIDQGDLPEYIGMKQLKHDKYLSLVYFLKGISYSSPTKKGTTPPYFELNWALALRKYMKVSDYNLNIPDEYAAALAEAATVMVDIPDDEIIGKSKLTAKEMGKFKTVDSKALEALITGDNTNLNHALAYRLAVKEKTTPKRLLDEEAIEKKKQIQKEQKAKDNSEK